MCTNYSIYIKQYITNDTFDIIFIYESIYINDKIYLITTKINNIIILINIMGERSL